jgi:hypothetical protein
MLKNMMIPLIAISLSANTMDTVLKHYNERDYLQSYQVLKESELDRLNNPKLHFYLGRSAFELKI